jgi:NADH-quinone oxidoreductase subunit E
MISDDVKQQMREICARYPKPRSGTLLCLHLAQAQEGYITPAGIAAVAEVTGSKRDEIESVVTFYSMYFREPPGRYVVNVCTSISCYLGGCDHVLAHLEERLDVKRGETRADGRYTLRGVECLAACGMAPVLQVNGEFVERVTTEAADALVDRLERGEAVASAPGAWNVLADGRPQDASTASGTAVRGRPQDAPAASGASAAEDAAGTGRQQGEKAR